MTQWGSLGIQAGVPCRVFLSYAHEDGVAAQQVHDTLLQLLNTQAIRDLGLRRDQIFFDVQRLKATDFWRPEILRSLEQCEILIFLVSRAALRTDGYCRSMELPGALFRSASPPLLVTVHLESVAHWDQQLIERGADRRPLGDSRALPPGDGQGTRPKPLNLWQPESEGWSVLGKELAAILLHRVTPPAVHGSRLPPASPLRRTPADVPDTGLLPYFCDQQRLAAEYEQGLGLWKRSAQAWALLVLFKGQHDDGLDKLAQRMRLKYLRKFFPGLPPPTPLHWPEPAGLKPDQQVACAVAELLETLGLDRSVVMADGLAAAARDLSQYLSECPYTTHLCACLPQANLREAGAGVLGFLRFLDTVVQPDAPVPGRLVIDLIIEPEAHELAWKLVSKWKLTGLQAVQVIEVRAPQPLEKTDLTNWHIQFVQPHFALEREDLLRLFARYFDTAAVTPLRLKTFAKVVGPLLT